MIHVGERAKRLYECLDPLGQAWLDRGRYALGLLPRQGPALRKKARPQWLPAPYRAALVVSADLELAWAWRYAKGVREPACYAKERAMQARCNMEALLALFGNYCVPVTWAVVGHLFLEGCIREEGLAHPTIPRLPHFENEFWRFRAGDWFAADPRSDWRRDPAWYAPDLIRAVLQANAGHEVACHTFSHVDLSDALCPPIVADGELDQCCALAREWGLELRSFVFPANLAGNRGSLKRHGFAAYRFHNGYGLDLPRQDGLGLWQIPGGVCWERPQGWPVAAWIRALERCVDRALDTGAVLHLWFHPSCEPMNVEVVFPTVLEYIAQHKDLLTTTMGGLVELVTHSDAKEPMAHA